MMTIPLGEQERLCRTTPVIPREVALQSLRQRPDYVRRHFETLKRTEAAHAEVLPGPLAKAFGIKQVIRVADLEIRPFRPSDWIILKELNAPLYQMTVQHDAVIEAAKAGKEVHFDVENIPYSTKDGVIMCYIFTRDPYTVWEQFDEIGEKAFIKAAMKEFGCKYETSTMGEVIDAIADQARISLSTKLRHEAANDEDAKKNTSLGQPASNQTG